jgi:hypothetical protein
MQGFHTLRATQTLDARRVVSSSEAAALHGLVLNSDPHPKITALKELDNRRKALTPWISGVISGAGVLIMWTIAGIIYYNKRRRRATRAQARGLKRRELPPHRAQELEKKWIIPPDPACKSPAGSSLSNAMVRPSTPEQLHTATGLANADHDMGHSHATTAHGRREDIELVARGKTLVISNP